MEFTPLASSLGRSTGRALVFLAALTIGAHAARAQDAETMVESSEMRGDEPDALSDDRANMEAAVQNPGVFDYRPGEGVTVSSGGYALALAGYIQPAVDTLDYLGSGPDGANPRFRLRRARLRIAGDAPDQRVAFRVQVDLSGSSEVGDDSGNALLDAFVSFRPTRTLTITFGQRPTYTDNRELFMHSYALALPERSKVTSAFASVREFGFFVEDRIRIAGSSHYLKPYLVVTNGDGPNVFTADHGGLKVGGRLDYLPFGLFRDRGQFRQPDMVRELTPKLVVGVTYSYNWGVSSRRGESSGDILYLDDKGKEALPGYGKLGADFLFKWRGFSLLGEFNYTYAKVPSTITQRVRTDGSLATTFDGGVDSYVKGRMMLGKGYNIQAGYMFSSNTSVDGRFTYLDADTDSFLNNATFYNRPRYYTLGVSQYFDDSYAFKIQASVTYVQTNSGTNDFNAQPTDGDELVTNVVTSLAF